jgi:hypothetical protein
MILKIGPAACTLPMTDAHSPCLLRVAAQLT